MSKEARLRFRNYLFRLRHNRGLSLRQLAILLGVRCHKTVSALERGDRLPTLEVALAMEVALGTRLSEIYPELPAQVLHQALTRSQRLPARLVRHIRGCLPGKD